jgi:hypothetical protein
MSMFRWSLHTLNLAAIALILAVWPGVAQAQAKDVYLNPAFPTAQRVDDLVGRMTLSARIIFGRWLAV